MSTHHTHSAHPSTTPQTTPHTVPLQLRFYIDREQLSLRTRFADRHSNSFRVLGPDGEHMPLRPDRPTGLLHTLLRGSDSNGEVTVEADVDQQKLTKSESQSYTLDRISWRTFHSNNNSTVPCEETSRGREKPAEIPSSRRSVLWPAVEHHRRRPHSTQPPVPCGRRGHHGHPRQVVPLRGAHRRHRRAGLHCPPQGRRVLHRAATAVARYSDEYLPWDVGAGVGNQLLA